MIFNDLETLCFALSEKSNFVEEEEEKEERQKRHKLDMYSAEGKLLTSNFLHHNLTLNEQSSKKVLPVVQELNKLLVKEKPWEGEKLTINFDTDREANVPKETVFSDEVEYEPDMRCILGYLNQTDSVGNVNIGNVM